MLNPSPSHHSLKHGGVHPAVLKVVKVDLGHLLPRLQVVGLVGGDVSETAQRAGHLVAR